MSISYFEDIEALLFHNAEHTASCIVFMISLVMERKKSDYLILSTSWGHDCVYSTALAQLMKISLWVENWLQNSACSGNQAECNDEIGPFKKKKKAEADWENSRGIDQAALQHCEWELEEIIHLWTRLLSWL